jgi:protein SOK2
VFATTSNNPRIPFERALDFANKEKITELLYPLFVHNIGALLCHPTNQSRNQVMAAAHRKHDALRPPPPLPALHHPLALPGPPGPLSHQPPMSRPSIDRTQSFPTPPASASTVMGNMNGTDGFQWNQQGMTNGQNTNQISIDTRLNNNGASLPNTPATTPPANSIQSIQYPAASQPYDNSRQMYQTSAPQTSSYPPPTSTQDSRIYGHGNTTYVKSEMAPPPSRNGTSNGEQADSKPPNGQTAESANPPEDEQDHEHDGEYTHDSGAYDSNRGSYNYSAPPVTSLQNDHSHLTSDMSGSPHQAGSGRATPRTAAPQPYYSQGYSSPPRVGQTSSNLYSVMSNERSSAPNGSSTSDVYGSGQSEMSSSMQNGYSQPSMNGSLGKRGRDDQDDDRSDLKRQRKFEGSAMNSPTYNNQMAQPVAAAARRR